MAGSLSTALLTGTTAGVVALLTLGLARAARRCGLPRPLAPARSQATSTRLVSFHAVRGVTSAGSPTSRGMLTS